MLRCIACSRSLHSVAHLPNSRLFEAYPLLGSNNVLFCSRYNFYGPSNLVLIGGAPHVHAAEAVTGQESRYLRASKRSRKSLA